MRFYYRGIRKFSSYDLFKGFIFLVLLMIGLRLCPRESLYDISNLHLKDYSIGIFLTSMSIIYLLINSAIRCGVQAILRRLLSTVFIITCAVISTAYISYGGTSTIMGISALSGIIMGVMLTCII